MTDVKPATEEEIAAQYAQIPTENIEEAEHFHPFPCYDPDCDKDVGLDMAGWKARIDADREEIAKREDRIEYFHGRCEDLNAELVALRKRFNEETGNFVECCEEREYKIAAQSQEIAALKADQADWRKGVGFIAAALGIDSLSCVDIAERGLEIRAERDALKAEVERPRCNDLLCRRCARRAR